MQSNFKATWILKKTGSTTSSWLEVGADSSNLIFGGHVGSAIIGVYKKVSGSQSNLHYTDGAVTSMNTEYPIEFTYENGILTVKCNGKTSSGSYTYTSRGYANLHIDANQMKELKIKPL